MTEKPTRFELPPQIRPPFEVFVNGVPQAEGTDYRVLGSKLLFERTLEREGKLGFWRWLSMFLGVAGTYRKHEQVSVVYRSAGRQLVANLRPAEEDS